ncbi:hypothetical protein BD289DRAFT_103332 [Coniella lustricola]|uniref:Secreted protein n=1 Tax=Coniella lustricola TaxID=2025994 RepID=A0A2T2ZXX5_9PEZI|nr:hypothetical protein BD289DRAFT_103332 [Coniella lustricola]
MLSHLVDGVCFGVFVLSSCALEFTNRVAHALGPDSRTHLDPGRGYRFVSDRGHGWHCHASQCNVDDSWLGGQLTATAGLPLWHRGGVERGWTVTRAGLGGWSCRHGDEREDFFFPPLAAGPAEPGQQLGHQAGRQGFQGCWAAEAEVWEGGRAAPGPVGGAASSNPCTPLPRAVPTEKCGCKYPGTDSVSRWMDGCKSFTS